MKLLGVKRRVVVRFLTSRLCICICSIYAMQKPSDVVFFLGAIPATGEGGRASTE